MSDLLNVQVQLYPEILRRMAAGEKLASTETEETEKAAASLLVAEAIEEQRVQEQPIEKKAIAEALLGAGLGAALGPALKRGINKLRGVPALPEGEQALMDSFKKILDAREEAAKAKSKLLLVGAGAAAAGALAHKALSKKDEKAAADIEETATQDNADEKNDVAESNIAREEEKPIEQTPEQKNARAVLDRLLKGIA